MPTTALTSTTYVLRLGVNAKTARYARVAVAKPVDEKSFFHCADCNFESPYKMYPGPDS